MTTALIINIFLAGALLAIVFAMKLWAIRTQHRDGIPAVESQRQDGMGPAARHGTRAAEPMRHDRRTSGHGRERPATRPVEQEASDAFRLASGQSSGVRGRR